MARIDRQRWDERWAERGTEPMPQPNHLLLRYEAHLGAGTALDLACGQGQNALWLAERGYHVTGLDVSPVALERGRREAKQRALRIDFVETDLDNCALSKNTFDVITVFRFLDRGLFSTIEAALRPGGWLFYETFNVRRLISHPHTRSSFTLDVGELAVAFAALEIVESADDGELSYLIARCK